jgi:hypothetical protein
VEDRLVPSTFVVTNTHDSGTGSLRWAITGANAATGQTNTIDFNVGGVAIKLSSALPAVTNPVVIDGLTNPGAHIVGLDGNNVSGRPNGLVLLAAGCTVEGLDVYSFKGNGLLIESADNTVKSNTFGGLGFDYAPDPNGNGIGIQGANADGNTIGGTTAAAANTILGNTGDGMFIDAGQNNVVVGNFIGTNSIGGSGLGNRLDGIHLLNGASSNDIGVEPNGGPVVGNVISLNGCGVEISGTFTSSNVVAGNKIGTDSTGTQGIGNTTGVKIDQLASGNFIGGSTSADANTISSNDTGVVISDASDIYIENNRIGTNAAGTAALGNFDDGLDIEGGSDLNQVLDNVISGNALDGVFISGTNTTLNVLTGNMIGTNAKGSAALPNGSDGVEISRNASGNTIGGAGAAGADVISGNGEDGVAIDMGATNNLVADDLIGVNLADTQSLKHQKIGVDIYGGATGNYIGTVDGEGAAGVVTGAVGVIGNVISGNSQDGVAIFNESNGNSVQANEIGTDQTGTLKIGNGEDGVDIDSASDNNQIGTGTTAGTNVISGNGQDGVFIGAACTGNSVSGDVIGTVANQLTALGNGRDGVNIEQGSDNTIGGPHAGDADVISGNLNCGIVLGTQATGNYVENDFIGVTAGSILVMPNHGTGVYIAGGSSGNWIGDAATGLDEQTVRSGNVISGNLGGGVVIFGAGTDSNTVEADEIGTNQSGASVISNQKNGVLIETGADFNTIGSQSALGADVISGNAADGVVITGANTSGNQVEGDLIGTNKAGTVALPNGNNGVAVADGANANVIGGGLTNQGNVISGNTGDGIELRDPDTDFNRVWNNTIGTSTASADGSITPLPNEYGVFLLGGASNNTIGGASCGNTIADNNAVGVKVTGSTTLGDTISQNSIYANGGIGIELGTTGVVPNGSGPVGPNTYQNYPVLSAGASPGTITITLNAAEYTSYTIELFSSNGPNQGENFLTSIPVTTTWMGAATYTYTLGAGVNATYPWLTATATDATGDTSEFSAPLLVAASAG